jgi:hypothetical protein
LLQKNSGRRGQAHAEFSENRFSLLFDGIVNANIQICHESSLFGIMKYFFVKSNYSTEYSAILIKTALSKARWELP